MMSRRCMVGIESGSISIGICGGEFVALVNMLNENSRGMDEMLS